jgi:hypothetical protein
VRYDVNPGPDGPLDRSLVVAASMLGALIVLAIAALAWAAGDHGTHCVGDGSAAVNDAGPYLHPIIVGCVAAGLALAYTLLVLSARRRGLADAAPNRPGIPSTVVAGLTVWCASVYLVLAFTPQRFDHHGLIGVIMWPPAALLIVVGGLVVVLQYALFLPMLVLLAFAFSRRSRGSGYRLMQITLVYAMFGCIAVAIGSAMLLTGFCGFG